jgi:hypothetical protein
MVGFQWKMFTGAEIFFDIFMSSEFDTFFENRALQPVDQSGE